MYNVFACNNSYAFAFVFHQLSVTAQNDEQSHIHFFVTALDKPFFSNRKTFQVSIDDTIMYEKFILSNQKCI